MSAATSVFGGVALLAFAAWLAPSVGRLDQRWLPAIRLASFGTPLRTLGVAAGLGWAVSQTSPVASGSHAIGPGWIPVVGAVVVLGIGIDGWRRRRLEGVAVRVATVNIERDSPLAAAIAGRLLDLDADLVLVQEYTPSTQAAFREAGLTDAYPHGYEVAEDGWFGAALLSRWPVPWHEVREVGARPMVVATVEVSGTAVTLVNVHLQAPIYRRDVVPWRTAFADLATIAGEAEGPVLLAGDWNATIDHTAFRRLLRTARLRDLDPALLRRTWPTDRRFPPLLCLDHLVASTDVGAARVRTVSMPGTDHRAVVADLRIGVAPRRRPPPAKLTRR